MVHVGLAKIRATACRIALALAAATTSANPARLVTVVRWIVSAETRRAMETKTPVSVGRTAGIDAAMAAVTVPKTRAPALRTAMTDHVVVMAPACLMKTWITVLGIVFAATEPARPATRIHAVARRTAEFSAVTAAAMKPRTPALVQMIAPEVAAVMAFVRATNTPATVHRIASVATESASKVKTPAIARSSAPEPAVG